MGLQSCTISKLLLIVDQIFAIDGGCLSLTHLFRVNP